MAHMLACAALLPAHKNRLITTGTNAGTIKCDAALLNLPITFANERENLAVRKREKRLDQTRKPRRGFACAPPSGGACATLRGEGESAGSPASGLTRDAPRQ